METIRFNRRPLRLDWLFSDIQPLYFVTFNTSAGQLILDRTEVHAAFREFCQRAYNDYEVAVGRYVLMPDHAHLFVAFQPDGLTLSKWVQSLRSNLGKTLLRIGFQKPHWQEGFFDHLLRSSESYSEKWEYVRMNPVRAGLCDSADDWPWAGEIVRIEF